MSNGQRAPWNNVDVTKCTRSICNEDIFWYWKNLIKSGVYVKELFREKYISMYISYISHLFIHLQKNVLNVCEDNLWLFWASRDTCKGEELQMYFHHITLRLRVGDMMSLAWHWIFCQCWSRWRSDSFQEAGRKTRSQIRLIQLKQFQRVSSPRDSHGTGTRHIRAGMRSVCTILFLEMVLITCF